MIQRFLWKNERKKKLFLPIWRQVNESVDTDKKPVTAAPTSPGNYCECEPNRGQVISCILKPAWEIHCTASLH